jgi:hypothetical protein
VQYVNDPHPWTEGVGRDLSMVDLVMNETIPAAAAAMLWWTLERGASLLTAGGPSGAGKTTLANACLSFLPDGARAYAVAGRDDPLLVPTGGQTYLLVSELSQHGRPYYIAGEAARRVFALVRDGHRVVGTLHADSVDEAIENLLGEVELSPEDVARVDLLAITRAEGPLGLTGGGRRGRIARDDDSVRRRIVEIALLEPGPDREVRRVELASWSAGSDRLTIADPPAGVAAVARWAGVPTALAARELDERTDVLVRLAAGGRRDREEVGDAVRRLRAR